MDWHWKKVANRYELTYEDLDFPSSGAVYHTGYFSGKLLDILQAGYYLKGSYWYPDLTERQIMLLDGIREEFRERGVLEDG